MAQESSTLERTQKEKRKPPRSDRPFYLIGELINHSFARARRAWSDRDIEKYQKLAILQTELDADFLTVNIDGTQSLMVTPNEMLEFLPELIPALQEVTDVPLSFDNPAIGFHREALKHYDQEKSSRSIFNSVAASRKDLEGMFELIAEYDTDVIVMASEKFGADGDCCQCLNADDVYGSAKTFVEMLRDKAGRTNDQIIIDPGLAPVGADTYGLVNMGLDGMRMIRNDPDMEGVHLSVGLTNFSFGTPKEIREDMENAYITLAIDIGLDFVLGNPEKDLHILDPDHKTLSVIKEALKAGRPLEGETQEDAGFRQAEKIMDLF